MGGCSEVLAPAVRKNSILNKMCRMGPALAVGGLEKSGFPSATEMAPDPFAVPVRHRLAKRRSASWLPPQCSSLRDGQGRERDDNQKEDGSAMVWRSAISCATVLPAQPSAVASIRWSHPVLRARPAQLIER